MVKRQTRGAVKREGHTCDDQSTSGCDLHTGGGGGSGGSKSCQEKLERLLTRSTKTKIKYLIAPSSPQTLSAGLKPKDCQSARKDEWNLFI